VSKFNLIWSTIAQESNLERKGQILGENHIFHRPPIGQCLTETFRPMFIHDFGHILLIGCPIDPILFRYVHNFEGIISTLLVGVFIIFLQCFGFGVEFGTYVDSCKRI
jgi:hypothetical protein